MTSDNDEEYSSAAQSLSTAHNEDGANASSGSSTRTSPSVQFEECLSTDSRSENDQSTDHSGKDQDEGSLPNVPPSVARVLSPAVLRRVFGQRDTTVSTPSENTDPADAIPDANTNRGEVEVSDGNINQNSNASANRNINRNTEGSDASANRNTEGIDASENRNRNTNRNTEESDTSPNRNTNPGESDATSINRNTNTNTNRNSNASANRNTNTNTNTNTRENPSGSSSSSVAARRRGKRIQNGVRVSGSHGMLVDRTDGKRRVRERIFGTVRCSVGLNKYKVDFDNNTSKECTSSSLRIETSTRSVPPNEIAEGILQEAAREDGALEENEAQQEATEHEIGVDDQHEGKYVLLVFVYFYIFELFLNLILFDFFVYR